MGLYMKVLLIGGTEFFGKLLVRQLLDAGHDLALLTRGNKKPQEFWSDVDYIECDRTHYADFHAKLSGKEFDVVIDNVVMDQGDVRSIIHTFASRPKPPHYICCSSVAVYEGAPLLPGGFLEDEASLRVQAGDDWKIVYANGKRTAEQYLKAHHGSMPYTIMRPTVIEGPGDPHKRTWFWMQRILDGGAIVLSTQDKETVYRHVSSADVAQAFFLVLGNKKAFNQTYNVAGEEILTIEAYLACLANALGKDSLTLCWADPRCIASTLPDYALPAFFERVQLISNIDKIKQELDYVPMRTKDWIVSTVSAFLHESQSSLGYANRDRELSIIGELQIIPIG